MPPRVNIELLLFFLICFRAAMMMRLLFRVLFFLVFTPLPFSVPALNLFCTLVAMADALLGMVNK
jgi:hypothetical protein